jgi:GNAT superfamily N-acetyltransferase
MATYFLEIINKRDIVPKACPDPAFTVQEMGVRQWQVNRFLYQFVGEAWAWKNKAAWTDGQWRDFIEKNDIRTWIGYYSGSIAGYAELQKTGDEIEINYFGLVTPFLGKGLGGHFLAHILEQGFAWGCKRIWVHTCDLDHPAAARNYQSRGMTLYKTVPENL